MAWRTATIKDAPLILAMYQQTPGYATLATRKKVKEELGNAKHNGILYEIYNGKAMWAWRRMRKGFYVDPIIIRSAKLSTARWSECVGAAIQRMKDLSYLHRRRRWKTAPLPKTTFGIANPKDIKERYSAIVASNTYVGEIPDSGDPFGDHVIVEFNVGRLAP